MTPSIPRAVYILVGTQCLFTLSDVMGRTYMVKHGFKAASLLSLWFLVYLLVRQVATFGQLYVFASVQLGRTMALFGAVSIVLSNAVGLLYLGEKLSFQSYLGVLMAILAFLIMAYR